MHVINVWISLPEPCPNQTPPKKEHKNFSRGRVTNITDAQIIFLCQPLISHFFLLC